MMLARRHPLALLSAAAVVSVLLALALGSLRLAPAQLLAALAGDGMAAEVLWGLRVPRVLSGFAAGGLLALSGALLQGLLRNPLADPYVLGVSGGAAVAALSALALGLAWPLVQAAAAGGALVTLGLLFVLARRAFFSRAVQAGGDSGTGVLLTGVMLGAFAAALLSLLLTLAPDAQLRPMMFWLLGDLNGATDPVPALAALALLALLGALASARSQALNLMLRGDVQAWTQGVDVARARRALVIVAALATGSAVTLAGTVGFVGFVAPHLVRLAWGNDQRVLLPASVLVGGSLVVLADTAARTALAPLQLPVGVLTAVLGVPMFLWLLARR